MPFSAAALGGEAFDQQGHLLGERVVVAVPPEGGRKVQQGKGEREDLQHCHRIFTNNVGVEIEAITKQNHLAGQAMASPRSGASRSTTETLGLRDLRRQQHHLQVPAALGGWAGQRGGREAAGGPELIGHLRQREPRIRPLLRLPGPAVERVG